MRLHSKLDIVKSIRYKWNSLFFPKLIKSIPLGKNSAYHISAFSYGNAGDTLLPVVLRDLFNQQIGIRKWHGRNVHKLITNRDILHINKHDFLVIGGGGLFISDTHPNDTSGWQWNCTKENLSKIEKPIIAFALGYNRFRGQPDFKPIFKEHLNLFVSKASFVGIRNHGSINALRNYLETEELKNKLIYQPCMTTVISKIYPNLTDYRNKSDFIAFNCAFDRKQMRSSDDNYLYSIARIAKKMSNITKIMYYSHMEQDKEALRYFEELKVKYELVELNSVEQIVECYSRPRLVIGMRGHAQMIPFGCCTPILSIISHDKMRWFLEDINHPEWGVDILDPSFEEKLDQKVSLLYNDYIQNMAIIEKEKARLWDLTISNMTVIKNLIKEKYENS